MYYYLIIDNIIIILPVQGGLERGDRGGGVGVTIQGENLTCNKIFNKSQCLARGSVVTVKNFFPAKRTEESSVRTNDIFLDVFDYFFLCYTYSGYLELNICRHFIKYSMFGFFFFHLHAPIWNKSVTHTMFKY